jgi:hypothetical protein
VHQELDVLRHVRGAAVVLLRQAPLAAVWGPFGGRFRAVLSAVRTSAVRRGRVTMQRRPSRAPWF